MDADARKSPALMPLEGAMLPAIEMKHAGAGRFAALHAALERWKRPMMAIEAPKEIHRPVQPDVARQISRAAYAYVKGKRQG